MTGLELSVIWTSTTFRFVFAEAALLSCIDLTYVPEDLLGNLMDLPGFEKARLTHYYDPLVDNPSITRPFNKLMCVL